LDPPRRRRAAAGGACWPARWSWRCSAAPAGVALGALVTAGYAVHQHWQVVVPLTGVGTGVGAALGLGAIAGLYPAVRAARLSPTDALRTV
jgi:ABC-type antimicrobial peptide transport system permease subunit